MCAAIGYVGRNHRLGDSLHQLGQGFHPGLVGDAEILVTAAIDDDGALLVGVRSKASRQGGLADPRLTGQKHRAEPTIGDHRLPGVNQPFGLGASTDEGLQPGSV